MTDPNDKLQSYEKKIHLNDDSTESVLTAMSLIMDFIERHSKKENRRLEFLRCRLRYPEFDEHQSKKVLHFEWSEYG